MAPLNKKLLQNEKDSKTQKEKILSSREKVLKIKRAVLSIVERMLEHEISEDWFLEKCSKLCHADYNDVIQERSIEHLCGYPLCSNSIKQVLKQKYHISRVTNKVYDLTERKCFCSNHCYKASNYLKAQLSPIPLYMRKEETIKVHLLSDSNNRGSAGEEIVFHHTIPQEEIHKVYTEEPNSNHYTNILNAEIKKCTDVLADLKVKENVFEKKYIFGDQPEKEKLQDPVYDDKNDSDSNSKIDSDDSEDEKLFPSYDNMAVLSDKHMPIPKRVKKSLLISPLPPNISTGSPVQQLSLNFVLGVFKDWLTEDTMKYLLGEKYVYGIKADHLFEKMTSDFIDSEKLSSIKNEYINLCIKIDNLPDTDISDYSDLDDDVPKKTNKKNTVKKNIDQYSATKKVFKKRPRRRSREKTADVTSVAETSSKKENILCVEDKLVSDTLGEKKNESCVMDKLLSQTSTEKKDISSLGDKSVSETSNEMENKTLRESEPVAEHTDVKEEKPKGKIKTVTFAPDVKDSARNISDMNVGKEPVAVYEEPTAESTWREPMFPLVDSMSQNALRRQVLSSKLKSVYMNLLPIIGLHYTDIRHEVKMFVDTLSLTPTNIMFKPKEWKLIAVILFRILTRTVLKDLHDETKLLKLCQDNIMPIKICARDIENLVHEIISTENIVTLK